MWKIDIWFFDYETIEKAEHYCENIVQQAEKNPGSKEKIIALKQELRRRDLYGFYKYSSMDVYRAVLEQNISNVEELLGRYVRKEKRL